MKTEVLLPVRKTATSPSPEQDKSCARPLSKFFNPSNAELNPICHLLALLGGATIVVVSR